MSGSIKEALTRASFQLKQAGHLQPRREAEALLCAAIRQPLAWLYAHGEQQLTDEAEQLFSSWVKRRCMHEPYAYICGEREFLGLNFNVTPAVLIPRPETELLVDAVVKLLCTKAKPRILEVGVGSGAIAVTLAVMLPDAEITAVDLSPDALAVAAGNAVRHQVQSRIRLLRGDLYAPVAQEAFDLLVSNPPYIPSEEIAKLEPTVRDFEPLQALDGGWDGLNFYRRLAGELHRLKNHPDFLAMEVGFGQAAPVSELCRRAGYNKIRQVPDLAGIPRIVIAES